VTISSALVTFFKALLTLSLGCFSSPGRAGPFLALGAAKDALVAFFAGAARPALVAFFSGAARPALVAFFAGGAVA